MGGRAGGRAGDLSGWMCGPLGWEGGQLGWVGGWVAGWACDEWAALGGRVGGRLWVGRWESGGWAGGWLGGWVPKNSFSMAVSGAALGRPGGARAGTLNHIWGRSQRNGRARAGAARQGGCEGCGGVVAWREMVGLSCEAFLLGRLSRRHERAAQLSGGMLWARRAAPASALSSETWVKK